MSTAPFDPRFDESSWERRVFIQTILALMCVGVALLLSRGCGSAVRFPHLKPYRAPGHFPSTPIARSKNA
jgi:hypothetical protein